MFTSVNIRDAFSFDFAGKTVKSRSCRATLLERITDVDVKPLPTPGDNMKRIPYLLLSLLLAADVQAAVVDHFHCSITATKAGGTLYSSEMDAYSVRKTITLNPNPGEWASLGDFVLRASSDENNSAEIHLYYQHAVQNGPDGKPAKARQNLCLAVSAYVDGGGSATMCLIPSPDPFGPKPDGWDNTEIKDGVPIFNVQNLRQVTRSLPNGISVRFTCDHLGTEQ